VKKTCNLFGWKKKVFGLFRGLCRRNWWTVCSQGLVSIFMYGRYTKRGKMKRTHYALLLGEEGVKGGTKAIFSRKGFALRSISYLCFRFYHFLNFLMAWSTYFLDFSMFWLLKTSCCWNCS
jgi:hypothetical protein